MVVYEIKDGNEVLTRLWNNVIATGAVNRRLDSSRLGLILSAIATELNYVQSIIMSYMSQFSLSTMSDKVLLENVARLFAVRRLASKSKAVITFTRINDYTESVHIPANFAVQTATGVVFKTISEIFLWKGVESASVLAYSSNSGAKYNVSANTLTSFNDNNFNTRIAVTNKEPAFGGYDTESLDSLRNRAQGFRYERDNTFLDLKRQMYFLGVDDGSWIAKEYINGNGSYLICLDCDSQYEYEDIINSLIYRKTPGITQVFVRAERIYINVSVILEIEEGTSYTPVQKEQIYQTIDNSVQLFFAAYCNVGASFDTNKLIVELTKALVSYDIVSIHILFNEGISTDNKNIIQIKDTQRFYPSQITTTITSNIQSDLNNIYK